MDSFVMVNVKQVRHQRTPQLRFREDKTDFRVDRSPIWAHTSSFWNTITCSCLPPTESAEPRYHRP